MTDENEEKPAEASAPEAKPETTPDPTEALRSELLYQRAEFDNYRKRMLRDQETAIRFANEKLIQELSGVVYHFERALSHSAALKAKATPDVVNFVSGIELTHRELIQLLEKFGVEFTGTVGETFDPQKHEALSQLDAPDESVGKILEVVQRGCMLSGRLLKPAKVIVGRNGKA